MAKFTDDVSTLFGFQDSEKEVMAFLGRKFTGLLSKVELVEKEDLDKVSQLRLFVVLYVFCMRSCGLLTDCVCSQITWLDSEAATSSCHSGQLRT